MCIDYRGRYVLLCILIVVTKDPTSLKPCFSKCFVFCLSSAYLRCIISILKFISITYMYFTTDLMKMEKDNIINFPSSVSKIERQVEAILFAASEPLDTETIEKRIKTSTNLKKVLQNLQDIYKKRGINLVCISKKWSFRTSPNLSNLMTQEKTVEKKLSKAAIETLAIIVYHQPVTRAEIEEIRGVAFGTNTLEILMELNWVKPGGRKNVPGRPIQYVTTDDFLSHFNLQKLSDLPTVDELGAAGLIDSTNIDNAIFGTGKFYKEKQDDKKEDIYSNIDEMLSSTLDSDEKN